MRPDGKAFHGAAAKRLAAQGMAETGEQDDDPGKKAPIGMVFSTKPIIPAKGEKGTTCNPTITLKKIEDPFITRHTSLSLLYQAEN